MNHTVAMIANRGMLLLPTGSKLSTTNSTLEVGDTEEEDAGIEALTAIARHAQPPFGRMVSHRMGWKRIPTGC